MQISDELLDIMDKQTGDMEKKMIEAFIKDRTIESIVEIAKATLREVVFTED
jgi:hypothetical protein